AVLIVGLLSLVPAWAADPGQPSDQELVAALRKGGYVLFVRHPTTNPDQADTDPLHLENTGAQRQLSEEGRRQAKVLGEEFGDLKEAEVVIFQPLGEKGFRLVRRVASPATWAEWAR